MTHCTFRACTETIGHRRCGRHCLQQADCSLAAGGRPCGNPLYKASTARSSCAPYGVRRDYGSPLPCAARCLPAGTPASPSPSPRRPSPHRRAPRERRHRRPGSLHAPEMTLQGQDRARQSVACIIIKPLSLAFGQNNRLTEWRQRAGMRLSCKEYLMMPGSGSALRHQQAVLLSSTRAQPAWLIGAGSAAMRCIGHGAGHVQRDRLGLDHKESQGSGKVNGQVWRWGKGQGRGQGQG